MYALWRAIRQGGFHAFTPRWCRSGRSCRVYGPHAVGSISASHGVARLERLRRSEPQVDTQGPTSGPCRPPSESPSRPGRAPWAFGSSTRRIAARVSASGVGVSFGSTRVEWGVASTANLASWARGAWGKTWALYFQALSCNRRRRQSREAFLHCSVLPIIVAFVSIITHCFKHGLDNLSTDPAGRLNWRGRNCV